MKKKNKKIFRLGERILMGGLLLVFSFATGCAHYPVNEPMNEVRPNGGYRASNMRTPENSDSLLLYLTFSGGGMRAAALSYGVLEELRKTEIVLDGRKRRLLDEVDGISSVSGGSFTTGYYGLFGDRVFEDFESKFLKRSIQRSLILRALLNVANWVRLFHRPSLGVIWLPNIMTSIFSKGVRLGIWLLGGIHGGGEFHRGGRHEEHERR